MLVEQKLDHKWGGKFNFCVSPNVFIHFSHSENFLTSAFIAVTFLKADICTRDHYMHVDVHRVVCSRIYMWQYTTSLYKLWH